MEGKEGHRSRLRERFERTGIDGFAEYEVLELLLTLCIPRGDVKPQAKALLQRFGSLREVLNAPAKALQQVDGIGAVTAIGLRIVRESANLYLMQETQQEVLLNSTERLEAFWRSRIGHLKHEVFEVAFLNKAYRLLPRGVQRLEEGDVDRITIYPRKIMAAALEQGAAALVIAHNHPTGLLRPSHQDEKLTQLLSKAASSLGIELVDHLIVGADECYSFRRSNNL